MVRREKIVCEDENLRKISKRELNEIMAGFNESIGVVVMSKENENNGLVFFINNEFEDKTFHNMDSSFSFEVVPERFVMIGVEDDFIDFFVKNFSEKSVFFYGF